MFGLFKQKSAVGILQSKYEKLNSQSHRLSNNNHVESNKKNAEAIYFKIEMLQGN
ncbi:Lacal_2735 family protein [Aquimarina sp. AD10]|uniref:Lacal_2735 family protein n=1 Tax=Aquimarina TaxID=290174 RepID=UPI000A7333BA|nr:MULTISPECIES: Lacal_2735 family protein [Aquimarina]AXT62728.1 Lacal_2735 family protein [Aquimarina sp. AD10]RKN01911.1 Lacal_2735 family protein [Aquimarina sp. AD10]